ncbi:MAG: MBG domain-containing protein [Clostridia bacterium]|nr:MBG domain-containing protein [Clostridia bacterium]
MSKKQITAISVTAKDKAYDGTVNAEVTVGELTEVLAADKPYVSVLGTAEFASADAGNDIVVTYTAQGLTGSASGNYALAASTATDTANITPANVDFVFGTLDYVYDTNTKTVPISATLNGAVFTNYTVSYTQGGNQVIPTAVGEYDIEIGLSGNYTGAPTGVKLNIISASQAQLIISGLSGTLDYDREFTLRTVGGSGSGVVSWTSSDTAIATVSDTGAVKIVGVGSVTITATKQSDGNYNEQTADISFDTTKKAVSFRLSGLSKTYDGNAQYAAVDTSVTENDYTVTYTDEAGYTVTEPREAGTYYVEVAAIGNYEGSASGVMTIAKARITGITAANVVMDGGVYGEVLIGAYLSGVTTPSGVTVAVTYAGAGIYTPQSALPTNAGSYTAIVTLSGNNYETLTLTKAFEITKKTLTVTAEDKTVKFGMPNPEFTLVYSGFVTGDDANVFIVAPIASTARAPQSAVGDYDIVVSGGRADNYEFDYVSGALTVSQYSETGTTLTLTGSKATAKVGEEFTVIARYGSEYPTIVWYSSDERVATVTDGVVKAIATGAVTITATIDDSRYETTNASFELAVTKTTVRLYATQTNKTYNGQVQEIELFSNNSDFEVTDASVTVEYFDENDSSAEPKEAGVYTARYTIVSDAFEGSGSIQYTITTDSKSILISNLNHTYNGQAKAVSVTGPASYDIVYYDENDAEVQNPTDAGQYRVVVTATGNYSGEQSAVMTIAKAMLDTQSTSVMMENFTYGETAPAPVVNKIEGTVAEITYDGDGIYTPQTEAPRDAGTYTVIAKIYGDNYEELTVTDEFIVEKAVLTVAIKPAARRYGEMNPEFEFEYTGFVNGDDESVILEAPVAVTTADLSSPVDTYDITASGGKADNYIFDCTATGTLTVTQADEGSAELIILGGNKNATVGDVFRLYAQLGAAMANVTWSSSDETVAAVDSATGDVEILKEGSVIITATLDDVNYPASEADFEISASKKTITLSAPNNVFTYTGEAQELTLKSSDENFVIDSDSVDVTYTLTTDASVTEAKAAGVYSVNYEITDDRYTGGGSLTMYISKAKIVVSAENLEKTYGEENPAYVLKVMSGQEILDADAELAALLESSLSHSSDADEAGAKANAGDYEITAALSETGNENCEFVISDTKGTLKVQPAPLTIKVKNVKREYGAENPALEAEYTGFVNGEDESVFTTALTLAYLDTINGETAIGTYTGAATASGAAADNYIITFEPGDVEITKIAVTASAGTSRSSYLTIKLDEAVEGMTESNFTVKRGDDIVALTKVSASSNNKTYTLSGSFSTSSVYTVTINLDGTPQEQTHEISGDAVSVKPTSGGGGGGSGSGSSSSGSGVVTVTTTYSVTYNTNGGSEIAASTVGSGAVLSEPAEPTREGYTFDGWYLDSELSEEYDFAQKVTKNFTLYAKWLEESTEPVDPVNPEWENPYTDVDEDDWFYNAVKYVTENGYFGGTSETEFSPNEILTRAMLVTALWRAEGEPILTDYDSGFTDLTQNWYIDAVNWATERGIVKGYSETIFAPDDNITREQVAAIMRRYASCKGIETNAKGDLTQFADADDISDWAYADMEWAVGAGLISGKENNRLDPQGNATRAEAAAILQRFFGSDAVISQSAESLNAAE